MNAGALMALVAEGEQDMWKYKGTILDHEHLFDTRLVRLERSHQVVYAKLDVKKEINLNNTSIIFNINKGSYNFINMMDLVLHDDNCNVIKRIDVQVDNVLVDTLCCHDIATQIQTNCTIFGRKLNTINGKTFIPLVMAPFHDNNIGCTDLQEFKIIVTFHKPYIQSAELYGNHYYHHRNRKLTYGFPEYFSIRNQYQSIGLWGNNMRLRFDDSVYMMYFWGFDKSKVIKITLRLNGHDYYDGPIEPIEHIKKSKGYDCEPCMFFFSHNTYDKPMYSTINFSRIDYAALYIQTTEENQMDMTVHVVALSLTKVLHILST